MLSLRVFRLPAGLLAACSLAGCGGTPPLPPEKPPPAPVHAVQAWTTPLDAWTPFPGATQPLPGNFARITAAVEGRVLSVLPAASGRSSVEGQWVDRSQVILQLDATIGRANLTKAEAAQKELGPQVQQALNAVQLARSRVERINKLKGNTITGTNLPLVSTAEAEQAQVALRDAEAQLQSAQAKLASGAVAIKALQEQLQLYTVRTPIAGWLSLIQVAPGQTIAVGTPIADVVDLSQIDVLCYVPPSRIGLVALGEPARIEAADTRSSVSAKAPEGKVVYVGVQGQPDTGSFIVKARVANQDLRLKSNTLVRLSIRTAAPKPRLVIPEAALLEAQEPPEVLVATNLRKEKDEEVGVVHHFRVVLGIRNRQRHLMEVLALKPLGQQKAGPPVAQTWFVTAGGHGLNDGDEVRMTRVSPAKEP